jgi:hypothetical protein
MDDPNTTVDVVNSLGDQFRDYGLSLVGRGISDDVFVPLLTDESPAARCGSAMFLLRTQRSALAVQVLEELAENDDYGSLASSADTALLVWRQEQRDARR